MNLLITNDDGWAAEGIEHLAALAAQHGNVTVVAPNGERSGIGHQLTMDRAMDFAQQKPDWYSLDGMPADCVRFGLHHLNREFDLVLSGINHGANLGVDVFTSGTVAAAREATFHGVSAIAFSQYRSNMKSSDFNWDRAADWVSQTLAQLLKSVRETESTSKPASFNVNLPDLDSIVSTVPEMVLCETDLSPLPTEYSQTGNRVQFSGSYQNRSRVAGKDVDVCLGGKIAVSNLV